MAPLSYVSSLIRIQDFGVGLQNGHNAWKALHTRYNNTRKEERRACYEELDKPPLWSKDRVLTPAPLKA